MKTSMMMRILFGAGLFCMTMLPFSPSAFNSDFSHGAQHGFVPGLAVPADDCPRDPPPPTVKIKVRVAACSLPGEPIEYRICVENCSAAEAHHVVVKNALPGNAKFVRSDPAPTPAPLRQPTSELQWYLGTIGGGATRVISLVLLPTNNEDVKNCVRVQFEHGQCVVTRQSASSPAPVPGMPGGPGVSDVPGVPGMPGPPPVIRDVGDLPPPDGKSPDPKLPLIRTVPDATRPMTMPGLNLTIQGMKDQWANLPVTYQIILTNKGNTRASNTQITVILDNRLKADKISDNGLAGGNTVTWLSGDLEPGVTRVVALTVRATAKGEFCLKAEAVADPNFKTDVEYCTKFVGVSAMTIEMFDRDDPVFLGEKNSYPITVRNQGSAAVTNLRMRAFLPDALKLEQTTPGFANRAAVKGGEWVEFAPVSEVEVGKEARYEIFVLAVRAGFTLVHVEAFADHLHSGRPVIEQELTNIVNDRDYVKVKALSRKKKISQ